MNRFIVIALLMFASCQSQTKTNQTGFDAMFTPDGGCPVFIEAVKKAMNDPNSFEHIKTDRIYRSTHMDLDMDYRGKNKFGGLVKSNVKGKVDAYGKVVSIGEE